jgi:tetratricopeptide (TPR) repeat protein
MRPRLPSSKLATLARVTFAASVLWLSSGKVFAQNQGENPDADFAACRGEASSPENADAGIAACTRLLEADARRSARRHAAVLTFRALALKAKGDVERAAIDFTQAITLAPDFAPAREARADLLRGNDQCDLAVADYDEAIKLAPQRPSSYVGRGLCLVDLNEGPRALRDFDQVTKLDVNNAAGYAIFAWAIMARLNIAMGNPDGALASLNEAINLDPKRAGLYIERGNVWSVKGDEARAIAEYDEAVKLDEKNAAGFALAAYTAKAQLHLRRGNFDGAITAYDEAIRLDPKRPAAYLYRASVWSRKGNAERASADYDKAVELDPQNAALYTLRGDFHRAASDYERAVKDYDKAIEKRPDDLAAYGNRALVRFYQGDFSKAAADFKRAGEGQENAYPILLYYVSQIRAGGKREEARDDLAKAAGGFEGSEWPVPLVELYLGKRSLDGALAAASKPEHRCEAQFYIGQWQLLRGNKAPASNALRTAVDTCPKDFIEYRGAVEELNRLKK